MSTLHPATRDAVSAMEPLDPANGLVKMRKIVLASFAGEPANRRRGRSG